MPVSHDQPESKPGAAQKCEDLHVKGLERGSNKREVDYGTACCFASTGDRDTAFRYLQAAAAAGYHDLAQLTQDADLKDLHADSRWQGIVRKVEAAHADYLKFVNADLYTLYQRDQADRLEGKLDPRAVSERDRHRRAMVSQMLAAQKLSAADDYYHAAMIFQHGDEADDYRQAKELAEKAFQLDGSLTPAKWLSAAAQDRYLWKIGKPQWYGTQFRQDQQGHWTIEPFDSKAVTDAQRALLGVPGLAETRKMIEQMNKEGLDGLLRGGSSPP